MFFTLPEAWDAPHRKVEGDDYDATTGDLRVLVVEPGICAAVTDLYTFHR